MLLLTSTIILTLFVQLILILFITDSWGKKSVRWASTITIGVKDYLLSWRIFVKKWNKICKIKNLFSNRNYKRIQLRLYSFSHSKGELICEFEDILNIAGHLTKIPAKDILAKPSLMSSVSCEDLIAIAVEYERDSRDYLLYRLKELNLADNLATFVNDRRKITVRVSRLLSDMELISRIKQEELVKALSPVLYSSGYNTHFDLENKVKEDAISRSPTSCQPSHLKIVKSSAIC